MSEPRRGLGPFTGTHLTVIVVALIGALLVPVSAVAVSIGRTAITSPNGHQVASVSAGRLAVRTQPLGTLTTQAAPPSRLAFSTTPHAVTGPGCTAVLVPPAGRALVVQSARLNVISVTSPGNGTYVGLYPTSACGAYIADANPTGLGQQTIDFGPGITIPAGGGLYAKSNQVFVEVSAYGFTVPAGSVPAARVAPPRGRRANN